MNNPLIYKTTRIILISLIFVVTAFHLLRVIQDPDFFWHLKTGEWIWQNKSLITEDPFAFTTPPIHSTRERSILTSSWLTDVIFYFLYLVSGMSGIVILRFIVAGFLIYAMFKREHGDDILYMCFLVIFLTQLLEAYNTNDRPQTFSFLFFAALLYFLERIKVDAEIGIKSHTLPLLLLMLVWANMHRGHVLGRVTIIIYIIMEGIKFIHPALSPMKKETYKRLLLVGISGIAISLINPNTFNVLPDDISVPAYMMEFNREYLGSLKTFSIFNDYSMFLYWFVLLLTIVVLTINIKKIDITELMLLAGTGFYSFNRMRYIPLFLIIALPVVGKGLSKEKMLKWSRTFIFFIALCVAVFFTWDERMNVQNVISGKWFKNDEIIPENAVEFIRKSDIKGNMYNHYNYGGYLIWRLAPERKVFIDGRNFYSDIFLQSMIINNAYEEDIAGMPYWKFILRSYDIRYIVVPLLEPSGDVLPLVNTLINDKEWIPVFYQSNSLIFVKNLPENEDLIKKYAIAKDYLIKKIFTSK